MSRKLEVLEAAGKFSRLTITPERVTVKILPEHADMAEIWVNAAEAIATRVAFDRSLRGRFTPELSTIWLSTDSHRDSFLYDFNGELVW